jgi:CubicO group peptidase (beta-lactamase class C family)
MKLFNRSDSSDSQKRQITLAQALSHTTGLTSDDNDSNSPGEEGHVQATSKDWITATLELPMAHPPGAHYAYSSMGLNLAMGAVGSITHRWAPEVFDEYLARPLGIDHYHLNLMPNGEAYGGGGMHMRPRDFLKFGQLFLDQGRWQGKPLLSAAWIKASTALQAEAPDGSSDGWGWHRHTLQVGDRSVLVLEANGNGGQFLFVVPAYDLTMVMTAGNYNQYGVWRRFREEWLPQVLLASAP